jgi:hypothetical protein
MKKRTAIAGLTAALATTALVAASATAVGGQNAQGAAPGSTARKATTVIKCDGGQLINMRSRIVNSPFTFNETGVNDQDQAVPGAGLLIRGPRKGTDTVLVTFSAESQITGGDANDWMGLETHLDGVPINPFTASGDVLAFTGEPSWNSNSMQFCTTVGRGLHKLQVFANLHDSSGSHTLHGWLDDYTVSFQRFN